MTPSEASADEAADLVAHPIILRIPEHGSELIEPEAILRAGQLDVHSALIDRDCLRVDVTSVGVRLQARGQIGVLPLNDRLTLEVIPRVPLGNMSRLLEISRHVPVTVTNTLRHYEAAGTIYPSLTTVYASGLRQSVDAIIEGGLLKEYQRIQELTSYPRGRIDMSRTMQQVARGNPLRAGVTYFRRSVDNPANRCLLFAAWFLAQYADRVSDSLDGRTLNQIRRDLNAVWLALPGVHLDHSEMFLLDPVVTGHHALPTLRSYYRPALDLALAIIGRHALRLEREGDQLKLPSLTINMAVVFEAYVRETLIRQGRTRLWPWHVLDGNLSPPTGGSSYVFWDSEEFASTPDVVLRSRTSPEDQVTHPVIVEVKYKPTDRAVSRDDLNQAITYGLSYRSPTVVLVQPRASGSMPGSGLRRLGSVGPVTAYQYVMDLSGDALEQEESTLADAVESLASAHVPEPTAGRSLPS